MVLLDIDRIPELMRASYFTSHNRFNWASFADTDHLGPHDVPFRERLVRDAARAGHVLPDGPVFLLTHLRYLGYCFNPVSFFYCYDTSGVLQLVLAEVNNTFGGTHRYWLRPEANTGRAWRSSAEKRFYVSPFMPPSARYTFAFQEPRERLTVHMTLDGRNEQGVQHALDATLSLEHHAWSHASIRRALVRHPVMTLAVMAGIHWEALRLWWKGLPLVPRPTATGVDPDCAVSESAPL